MNRAALEALREGLRHSTTWVSPWQLGHVLDALLAPDAAEGPVYVCARCERVRPPGSVMTKSPQDELVCYGDPACVPPDQASANITGLVSMGAPRIPPSVYDILESRRGVQLPPRRSVFDGHAHVFTERAGATPVCTYCGMVDFGAPKADDPRPVALWETAG